MSQTVRLSVQLWDPERRVRMSVHRDTLTSDVLTAAGEIVGDILPSFTRRNRPKEKSRGARVESQTGNMFLRNGRRRG